MVASAERSVASDVHHESLHGLTRASGGRQLLMGPDPRNGNRVLAGLTGKEGHDRRLLGAVWRLPVVVSKHDDAEITRVLTGHVSPLVTQWTTTPDSAGRIDGVVVPDISEALRPSLQMRTANRFESSSGSLRGGTGEWLHSIVMNGDPRDRTIPIHP